MKKITFLLFAIVLSIPMFSADLVLIRTSSLRETQKHFKDQLINIHYYDDHYIIATTDQIKQNYIILDSDAWEEQESYFFYTLIPEMYFESMADIEEQGRILFSENNLAIVMIEDLEKVKPITNDGIMRITPSLAKLPTSKLSLNSPGMRDDFVLELLAQIDNSQMLATIQHLQDYGTRNWHNDISKEAQAWLRQKFEALGYETKYQNIPNGSNYSENVIATKTGTVYPEEYIVIGAHYDSYASGNSEPGADDNASGTSAVLEIARILAPYDLDRSIVLCTWSGEEYGLYGSDAYADSAKAAQMNIIGYLNMDMIAYRDPGTPIQTSIVAPSSAQDLVAIYELVAETYYPEFEISPGVLYGYNSDHASFNNNGFMGIFPFEHVDHYSPYIHTPGDTIGTSVNSMEMASVFMGTTFATAVTMSNNLSLVGIEAKKYQEVKLSNYPNPAQNYTTIQFVLNIKTSARIEICELNGKLISIPIHSNFGAGTHSFNFDTSDLASGIYNYSIITDLGITTNQMIIR